jgi:FkbM family methyltransferase
MSLDIPVVLKTKYAYHALLWLLKPDVVLDVGSLDGSDSKRFRMLLPRTDIVAFEGNPYNYGAMLEDREIARKRIRVVNKLVSDTEGRRSFFVQRPRAGEAHFNRGTSSLTRRDEAGLTSEEVRIDAVRIDSFLAQDYPMASRVALWIDVEGHAYSVIEGVSSAKDRVKLMHVEVETAEVWAGQKVEADVLHLAEGMDYIVVARGVNAVQRDLILANRAWYEAEKSAIHGMLRLCGLWGPGMSRVLCWVGAGRRRTQNSAR